MSLSESRSDNRVPTLGVLSNANDGARVALWADPTTHRLLVDASVTSVVTDIEDGTGDSIMDAANDSMNVTIVSDSVGTLDTDDDDITKAQVLPLIINENYVFAKTADNWVRMQASDDGYLFTRPIGIYTPDGDSAMNDTSNSVVVSGTVDTELPAAAALSDAIGNPTTPTVGAAVLAFNGTNWNRVRNIGDADDQSGTDAILRVAALGYYYDGAAYDRVRGNSVGGAWVQGAIADDAADSGNPVKVGGVYNSSAPTLDDGDRGDFQQDVNGNLYVTLATALDETNDAIAIYGSDDGGTTMRIIETDSGGAVAIQDGGNVITVDGTVTANLSATDNAVLDDISADTGNIDADTGNLVKSLVGAAAPTIDSYTHAAINLAAGANQVLVASAANKQIWVYGIGFTVNVAGTVSFQDEDDTAITGIMNIAASSGIAIPPSGNFSMPIWKLGTDKDLEVDVVTAELDGWICYSIVSV